MFYKKGVLENFVKFTGKHLCQRLFLIKLQPWGLQLCHKRDSVTGVFLWILRNIQDTFNNSGRLLRKLEKNLFVNPFHNQWSLSVRTPPLSKKKKKRKEKKKKISGFLMFSGGYRKIPVALNGFMHYSKWCYQTFLSYFLLYTVFF